MSADNLIANSRRYFYIILIIAFLSTINLIIFINYGYKKYAFNSDSAIKQLLSIEIINSGNFFPSSWAYFNNDIFIFFGQIFNLPFVWLLGPSYTAYVCGTLLSSIVLLFSLWLIFSLFIKNININIKLILLIICMSGISLRITENLFGDGAYGIVICLSSFLIFFSFQALITTGYKQILCLIVTLLITITVVSSNPGRAIVFYITPLLFSIIFHFFSNRTSTPKISTYRNELILVLTLFGALVIGIFLHRYLLKTVFMQPGYAYLNFDDVKNIFKNLGAILVFLLNLFGGEPVPGRNLISMSGIYDLFRLFIAICLVILITTVIVKMLKCFRSLNSVVTFVLCYALTGFLSIIFIICTTTNLKHPNYLIPSVIFLILVSAYHAINANHEKFSKVLLPVLGICVFCNSITLNTNYWYSFNMVAGGGGPVDDPHLNNSIYKLIDVLEKNKLTYGYAPYWYANMLTVLTGNEIKVRPVDMDSSVPVPRLWGSSTDWYRKTAPGERSFLILLKNSMSTFDLSSLRNSGLDPIETIDAGPCIIFVFEQNISNLLPGWAIPKIIRF